jgi:hypothetical protein
MARPTKVRIRSLSHLQLSNCSLSKFYVCAIIRKCPVGSDIIIPLCNAKLCEIMKDTSSALHQEVRDVIKVNEFDCPAGEWGCRRKYFGRRELVPTSPQLTLRSQPEKVSGLPTRQISYPLSWYAWPSSRTSFWPTAHFICSISKFQLPSRYPGQAILPQKAALPLYGVTSGMNLRTYCIF